MQEISLGRVMRQGLLTVGVSFLCVPVFCHAQNLYVSGYRELMLRTGPSRENKIIAVLKTGKAVELIAAGEDYYLVALPDGRQGYVLKDYVTEQAPAEYRVQILEKKVSQQAQELEHLREDNARLQSVYEETQHSAIDKDTLLQRVTAERDQLRGDTSVSTFLAGAGVLLIGWLLGWTRLRLRRKVRRRQGLSL